MTEAMKHKVLITRIDEAYNKIEALLAISDKSFRVEAMEEAFDQLGDIYDSFEFISKTLDSFETSDPENEQEIFADFLALKDIEKEIIVKLMDIYVKYAEINEESDLEKKKTWLRKIKYV